MNEEMIDCKECGDAHEVSTSLNGYCDKCVTRFIEAEERKLKEEFDSQNINLNEI